MVSIPQIPMFISDELKKVLALHEIKISDYKPAYGGTSVGLDLYNTGPKIYVPSGAMDYKTDWAFAEENPDEKITRTQFTKVFSQLIPTGLHLALPACWAGLIQERGSIIKHPLKLRAGVIDPDYTGQVFVNCVNLSSHPWEIPHGAKLPFQLVVLRANTNFFPVSENEYSDLIQDATRKKGMVGSSDE